MDELVTLLVMFPLAGRVPDEGRTFMPDHVICERRVPEEELSRVVMVVVMVVVVMIVVPRTTALPPDPEYTEEAAVTEAPVSKTNPVGAVKTTVEPLPHSLWDASAITGPVSAVTDPNAALYQSAEIFAVAGVTTVEALAVVAPSRVTSSVRIGRISFVFIRKSGI